MGDWLQEPPAEAAPPAASDGKKKGLGLSLKMSPDAVTAKALERRASLKQSGEANAMLQIVTSSTSDAAVCSYTRSTHGTALPAGGAAVNGTVSTFTVRSHGCDALK